MRGQRPVATQRRCGCGGRRPGERGASATSAGGRCAARAARPAGGAGGGLPGRSAGSAYARRSSRTASASHRAASSRRGSPRGCRSPRCSANCQPFRTRDRPEQLRQVVPRPLPHLRPAEAAGGAPVQRVQPRRPPTDRYPVASSMADGKEPDTDRARRFSRPNQRKGSLAAQVSQVLFERRALRQRRGGYPGQTHVRRSIAARRHNAVAK